MGLFYYFHYHPDYVSGKNIEHYSLIPHPFDFAKTGYFSDVLYHSRNTNARFYIITFGYEEAWPQKYCPPRVIDRYHLHFVFDGEGLFNGQPVHAGQIFIAPANQSYDILHSATHPMKMGWIGISGRESEEIIGALHLPQTPVIDMNPERIDQIRNIFLDVVYAPHPDVDLPFYLFGRAFHVLSLSGASSSREENPATSNYTQQALNYINVHYMDDISISDIAKAAHITESYLRALFTKELGVSPREMILQKRVSAAKELLRQEEIPIATIAESCSYADRSAFAKRFKKITGLTPAEYRRKATNK